jgi:hypothetical protein
MNIAKSRTSRYLGLSMCRFITEFLVGLAMHEKENIGTKIHRM